MNRPELLLKTDPAATPVIDVARILTSSQERELAKDIAEIERLAKAWKRCHGHLPQVRLRVLTQTFPNTPGPAGVHSQGSPRTGHQGLLEARWPHCLNTQRLTVHKVS